MWLSRAGWDIIHFLSLYIHTYISKYSLILYFIVFLQIYSLQRYSVPEEGKKGSIKSLFLTYCFTPDTFSIGWCFSTVICCCSGSEIEDDWSFSTTVRGIRTSDRNILERSTSLPSNVCYPIYISSIFFK